MMILFVTQSTEWYWWMMSYFADVILCSCVCSIGLIGTKYWLSVLILNHYFVIRWCYLSCRVQHDTNEWCRRLLMWYCVVVSRTLARLMHNSSLTLSYDDTVCYAHCSTILMNAILGYWCDTVFIVVSVTLAYLVYSTDCLL